MSAKSPHRSPPHISLIGGDAIARRIDELAAFTDEAGGLTRLTLGAAHKQAANKVAGWMQDAGLDVHIDALGTIVGRLASPHQDARILLIGSHIDTVRNAGRFDGNLGVIAAIAVAAELKQRREPLPYTIEILAFGDEEGVRFASTLTGSRAVAGCFDPAALDDADANGVTRREALRSFGADSAQAALIGRDPARIIGYIELHIEQGPVLESLNLPAGIVTAINGAMRGMISVQGQSGHAGTLPMNMRRDALAAAAELILAIEAIASRQDDLVATVGTLDITGGAVNTVPGTVNFSLDMRAPDDAVRKAALAQIRSAMNLTASQRDVRISLRQSYEMPATHCDENLVVQLESCFQRLGHNPFKLASGAGHDAMSFRGRMPCAMIFTRCRGGVSHHPGEFAAPEDMEIAARLLHEFTLALGDRQ